MHAVEIYDRLTGDRGRFVRVDELCRRAAATFPGSLPSDAELAAEARLAQRDKKGLEKAQGEFLAEVLADPAAGTHLCHAMLLPKELSKEKLGEFEKKGEIDLGGAQLRRQGKACVLTMNNPRYLNAEDESTIAGMETAVDVALADAKSEVCVLRGAAVEHPKYAGRRIFGAGINLTHLYEGRIRYLWYLIRDLGLVSKFYRGLASPDASPELVSTEKLWIAAVEGFAIGGHCQILLTMDYTIAAADASLYRALVLGEPLRRESIQHIDIKGLMVLPSSIDLTGAEVELADLPDRAGRLRAALAPIREEFRFILIDCPPSLGFLTLNALRAADEVLIPIQAEYFALEGLARLMKTMERIRASVHPGLQLGGIVITMYDGRTNLSRQVGEDLRTHLPHLVYKVAIPRNVRLAEAPSHGKPVIAYDISSPGAQAYLAMAGEFLARAGRRLRA